MMLPFFRKYIEKLNFFSRMKVNWKNRKHYIKEITKIHHFTLLGYFLLL